jgi:hypothetical protein
MRVFSAGFGRRSTPGRSWAVEGAQEQVDRDTPVSRTPTIGADLGAPATSSWQKAKLWHKPTTLGYYYYCRTSPQPLTAGITSGSGLRSAGSLWRLSWLL